MAQQLRFTCNDCGREVSSWSDGNPYFIDESGQKQYAYHPDHERLALCIGNDAEHLCLTCGLEFKVDSRSPTRSCPKCHSTNHVDTYELDGSPCPFCKRGTFRVDSEASAIS
jgi:DNA-directed RNA polymerase subunit RPC12/RpoP